MAVIVIVIIIIITIIIIINIITIISIVAVRNKANPICICLNLYYLLVNNGFRSLLSTWSIGYVQPRVGLVWRKCTTSGFVR